ncbi:MAG: hypothetical protein P1V97_33050 [Planctomycetota bacterium]|nr:hypothetical protein [Planctomycetota bacterium]
MSSWTRLFVFSAILLLATGCIKRKLFIRPTPKDARVFLDGIELENNEGVVEQPFTFYGTRSVTTRRRGYKTNRQMWTIPTPWYSRFPIDFFTELVIPWTIDEKHEITVSLEQEPKNQSKSTQQLIQRAEDMAKEAGSELRR